MQEEEYWSTLLKIVAALFILSLIVSFVRSEVLLIPIHQPQVEKVARLSAYLSVSLSVIYKVLVVCLIFAATWFFLKLCNFEINSKKYLEATGTAIAMFMYNPIINLVLIYFLLYKEVHHLTYKNPDSVRSQIQALTFTQVSHYLFLVFIFLAIAAFTWSLKEQKVTNKVVLSSSTIAFVLLVIFTYAL
jgi:hypothetical protein